MVFLFLVLFHYYLLRFCLAEKDSNPTALEYTLKILAAAPNDKFVENVAQQFAAWT